MLHPSLFTVHSNIVRSSVLALHSSLSPFTHLLPCLLSLHLLPFTHHFSPLTFHRSLSTFRPSHVTFTLYPSLFSLDSYPFTHHFSPLTLQPPTIALYSSLFFTSHSNLHKTKTSIFLKRNMIFQKGNAIFQYFERPFKYFSSQSR